MVRAERPVAQGQTTTGASRHRLTAPGFQRKIPIVTAGAPRQLIPTDACAAHRKSANATGSTISLFSSLIMVGSQFGPQLIVAGYGKYFAKWGAAGQRGRCLRRAPASSSGVLNCLRSIRS